MRLVGVVGPTASGKTKLSLELAKRLNGEVVGVDASQIYRGMDIGTGKATQDELGGVAHHLLSIVEPHERFDAAQYVRTADAVIHEILKRGRRPILCGGTGLYLRALLKGLCEAPPVDPRVRQRLQERLEAGDVHRLHSELAAVDQASAGRINRNDGQRIERALGVYLTTAIPLSEWQDKHRFQAQRYPTILIGLKWERSVLNMRIRKRIELMFAAGWVQEVDDLIRAGVDPDLPSMKALGYSYIAQHLHGELTLDEAKEKTFIATRRYAKRQMTWFKSLGDVQWFDGETALSEVLDYAEKELMESGE